MTNDLSPLTKRITDDLTPGARQYEVFRATMLRETHMLMLVWEDLHPTMQAQWEQVAKNMIDEKMTKAARIWDAFVAITNDSEMPSWEGLSLTRRVAWMYAFNLQDGPKDWTEEGSMADTMEQLRRMRQYSKCFTNAFDRKQAVFVLVEQDKTAYISVAQWIKSNIDRLGAAHPKIISAKATMARFMEFPDGKEPD